MHFLWKILQEILREIFKICKSFAGNAVGNSVGNVVGNAAGNLAGNGLGNDAVFSLNMWLRTIYYLQIMHELACVILTLFQYFLNFAAEIALYKYIYSTCICVPHTGHVSPLNILYYICIFNANITRMHSSRMRTSHLLTICLSLLLGGGGGGGVGWGVRSPKNFLKKILKKIKKKKIKKKIKKKFGGSNAPICTRHLPPIPDTPPDQTHTHPLDQTHPPRPDTHTPPRTKYTPRT